MQTKKHKYLFGIPSWGLSLLTAILSLFLLLILAELLGSIFPNSRDFGEVVAYIVIDIVIALACFFICRQNPKSIYYVPILCNIAGIISAVVEPNFWITSLWIVICGGWILSVLGAIIGATVGRQSLLKDTPK